MDYMTMTSIFVQSVSFIDELMRIKVKLQLFSFKFLNYSLGKMSILMTTPYCLINSDGHFHYKINLL